MMKIFKPAHGFTLIELLTVISIIGVLTGLLTFSYLGVRQRARDTQRKSDLAQIQSALELYRADNNQYPAALPSCGAPFTGVGGTVYMQKMPCDPQESSLPYFYSNPSSSTYILASCLENGNDKDVVLTPPAGMTACTPEYYFIKSNP